MSSHKYRAEQLLESLDEEAYVPVSDRLVTAIAALAESNLALTESQARLADAIAHPPAYTVRKDGLGGGRFGKFMIEPGEPR